MLIYACMRKKVHVKLHASHNISILKPVYTKVFSALLEPIILNISSYRAGFAHTAQTKIDEKSKLWGGGAIPYTTHLKR